MVAEALSPRRSLSAPSSGQELKIYGPGGPEPAIREAAAQRGDMGAGISERGSGAQPTAEESCSLQVTRPFG